MRTVAVFPTCVDPVKTIAGNCLNNASRVFSHFLAIHMHIFCILIAKLSNNFVQPRHTHLGGVRKANYPPGMGSAEAGSSTRLFFFYPSIQNSPATRVYILSGFSD
ncbi:MAG: hypothetical protein LUQ65_06965 [Candidatus Helarchaeota archaeon]|nr:hypothetical protein [Candidatus Helarchaeota archaeon]